jgi:hypothetical protein
MLPRVLRKSGIRQYRPEDKAVITIPAVLWQSADSDCGGDAAASHHCMGNVFNPGHRINGPLLKILLIQPGHADRLQRHISQLASARLR